MRGFYSYEDEFPDQNVERDFDEGIDILNLAQIDWVSTNLSQQLLGMALKLCERDFFWKFRSVNSKLRAVDQTYNMLDLLINPD